MNEYTGYRNSRMYEDTVVENRLWKYTHELSSSVRLPNLFVKKFMNIQIE